MSISGISLSQILPSSQGSKIDASDGFKFVKKSREEIEAEDKQIKEKFLKFAQMSPAERIRAAYLERNGLTEDSLKALSEEERKRIEEEIKQEIKEKLGVDEHSRRGSLKDISV